MKLFIIAVTLVTLLVLTGCHTDTPSDPAPPSPIVENSQDNFVTKRQGLVEAFHTAEVYALPYDNTGYVVRDTNGAVWVVCTDTSNSRAGAAMIFAGTNKNFRLSSRTQAAIHAIAETNQVNVEDAAPTK